MSWLHWATDKIVATLTAARQQLAIYPGGSWRRSITQAKSRGPAMPPNVPI